LRENIDLNLFNEAPQNIKFKKVKLNNIFQIQSHVIDTSEAKLNWSSDYPALTICKKQRDGKQFDFNMPLNLAPTIQKAIQFLIDENPQFFRSASTSKNHSQIE